MFTNVVIQNKESEARDHLSNERTLLAWFRTSFTVAAIGLFVLRTQGISTLTKVAGIIFLFMGMIFVVFGMVRYTFVQNYLLRGEFPSNGSVMAASSCIIIFLYILVIIIVFIE